MSKVDKFQVLKALDMAIRRCDNASGMPRGASDLIAIDNDYELAETRIKAANAMLSSAVSKIMQVLEEIKEGGKGG